MGDIGPPGATLPGDKGEKGIPGPVGTSARMITSKTYSCIFHLSFNRCSWSTWCRRRQRRTRYGSSPSHSNRIPFCLPNLGRPAPQSLQSFPGAQGEKGDRGLPGSAGSPGFQVSPIRRRSVDASAHSFSRVPTAYQVYQALQERKVKLVSPACQVSRDPKASQVC